VKEGWSLACNVVKRLATRMSRPKEKRESGEEQLLADMGQGVSGLFDKYI